MADLTSATPKKETLITEEVSQFVHYFTIIGITMGLTCFILAFILGYFWIDAILFLIGVIVANVPEGFIAVVTISLSISAARLSKRNCIVKNLEAVETIGATSIILCDKTGTLTLNQPSVAHVWIDNSIGEVDTAADENPAISFDAQSSTWKNLARVAVLCSRAEFASNDSNDGTMRREVVGKLKKDFTNQLRFTELYRYNLVSSNCALIFKGVPGSVKLDRSMNCTFSFMIYFKMEIH